MSESLKSKVFSGVVWTGIEGLANQAAAFVISIILARLLTPADYGIIGIMNVFLGFATLFIDCGLSSGLLRKKDKTDIDYSTVFWSNLAISTVCYLLLFAASPWIASFYENPLLRTMLRVLGLILIINAFHATQITRMTALINFKSQAKISFTTSLLSGAFGIWLAHLGFGAWSLVWQSVFASAYRTIAYWYISNWHPQFVFSTQSFHSLFSFGSRILCANVLHTIYTHISPLIIGKKYSAETLGIYTRADSLVVLPGTAFQATLGRVIYPVLVTIKDDEQRLIAAYRKYLRVITSLVAPSMFIFGAVSKPLVLTLLGEKWLACTPFIMLLSLAWMIDPIITVNLNMLYIKGRSDIVLNIEFIKKAIAITIVVIAVQFGVIWLCVGRLVYSYIALAINLLACGPFIGMSLWKQIQEVWIVYLGGFLAGLGAYLTSVFIPRFLPFTNWWTHFISLTIASLIGLLVYYAWAEIFNFEILQEAKRIIKKK